MNAAKALIEVRGGVIPGESMPKYTRQWGYTSEEYEKDKLVPPNEPTIFSRRLTESHTYAMSLSNPAYVNWVRVDWIWL